MADKVCPDCGQDDTLVVTHEEEKWLHGFGDDQVELGAVVPVYSCKDEECGHRYTNHEAFKIQRDVVRAHYDQLGFSDRTLYPWP